MAVVAKTLDPQVSACPICRRHWTQAHVLCDCPCTTSARTAGSLDLTVTISRLNPSPMWELDRKFQLLLTIPSRPSLMARQWSVQWDQAAIGDLQNEIARCTRKQFKAVLGSIDRITCASATACWRDFILLSRELLPPAEGQMSTIDWGPGLGEDHG